MTRLCGKCCQIIGRVTFIYELRPHSLGSRRPQPTTAPKPKPPPVPEPEPEPEPTEDPNVDNPRDEQCSRSLVFDAATSIRGDLYFFKTGYLYLYARTVRLKNISSFPLKSFYGIGHLLPGTIGKRVQHFKGSP